MKITGGFFSQKRPLVEAFESKRKKIYLTGGAPLILLAYYDKQYPADSVEPDLIPQEVGEMSATMVASGVWQRIWVYDRWQKRILWVYPVAGRSPSVTMLLGLLLVCAVAGLAILGWLRIGDR